MTVLFAYLLILNVAAFLAMGADKKRAIQQKRRIPEKTLFIWSAVGGSLAMFITMQLIRHKTKHASFMVGIPVIFILQVALIAALAYFKILPPLF